MALGLRVATPGDAGIVSDILVASYGTLWEGHYDAADLAVALPIATRAQPSLLASGRYFITFDGAEPAAVGGWSLEAPGSRAVQSGLGHVRHFATHPAHLRKGAAQGIFVRCLDEARREGLRALHCVAGLPAEGFWAAQGFAVLGRQAVPIGATMMPSVIMSRAV